MDKDQLQNKCNDYNLFKMLNPGQRDIEIEKEIVQECLKLKNPNYYKRIINIEYSTEIKDIEYSTELKDGLFRYMTSYGDVLYFRFMDFYNKVAKEVENG